MPVVKAKNSEWLDATVFVQEIAKRTPKNDAFVYRVRRLLRVVMPHAKQVTEDQQQVYDEFTMRDADDKPVFSGPGELVLTDPGACRKKVRALMETTAELLVEPITSEELSAEGIKITGDLAFKAGPLLLDPKIDASGVTESSAVDS